MWSKLQRPEMPTEGDGWKWDRKSRVWYRPAPEYLALPLLTRALMKLLVVEPPLPEATSHSAGQISVDDLQLAYVRGLSKRGWRLVARTARIMGGLLAIGLLLVVGSLALTAWASGDFWSDTFSDTVGSIGVAFLTGGIVGVAFASAERLLSESDEIASQARQMQKNILQQEQ